MYNNRYRSRSFALKHFHSHNRGMFISVVFLGGIILTFLLAYVAFGNDLEHSPSSLKLVVIFHRHGDRTPTKLYKKDPYNDVKKYWPIGLGQLTVVGKQQLYRLGKIFHDRYKSFISKFSVQTVRVDSSDVDRTLMSAGALLAAWFPPRGDEIWNNDLNWQPIPIHTVPRSEDKLISLKAPCPKYSAEKDKLLEEFKQNETAADKEFYSYLTENTGQKMDSIRDTETLYSILYIEHNSGHALPEWTKKIFPDPLKEKASISMATFAWNKPMQRLHGGNFLNALLKHFQDKVEGKSAEKKLHLYSGHDISIVTIWRTFGFDEYILPSFGASLIWEMHKYSDKYFIKMFYLNDTINSEPLELHIPKCSQPCPLTQLVDITEEVRPSDWEKECEIKHNKS